MTKQQIIDYVMETPQNTNPAILSQMLDELGGEGGGGSSDFSTATVTIVVNGDVDTNIFGAFYADDEYGSFTYGNINSTYATSEPLNIILYKNYAFLSMDNFDNINVVGQGDITINVNGNCDVTGDCTITISPKA